LIKNFIFAFLTALLFFSDLAAQSNCKLRKDQGGIKVYTCHTDTSHFKSIVAEFTINATLDELTQFVLNIENYTRWQYNTVTAKTVRKISATELIYRTEIKAPWPVTDRDMVVHLRITNDEKSLIIKTESEAGIIPLKKEFIRVPSSHAMWIVNQKSERQLQVKYTMQIDPGGSVPVWLVNWVCAQAPYQSFKNLKEQMGKE